MATQDPGFQAEGLVAAQLDLRPRYEREEWVAAWERLLDGTRALPGVTAAAVTSQVPFTGDRMISPFRPEDGAQVDPAGEVIVFVAVGGDFLRTLGTRLVEGRAFRGEDEGGEPVVMVNEAFVRRYWPDRTGVGETVRSGGEGVDDEPVYRVVGVLADMTARPGQAAVPRIFVPHTLAASRTMELVVRTSGDAGSVAEGLRDVVRTFDPTLPVTQIRTVASLGREALAPARFYAGFFGGFAVVALLLAAVGVYGTTAFVTRTRTREIGIRMALGARREQVVRGIVRRSGSAVGLGVAVGLLAAFLGAGVMERMLAEVAPREPTAYVLVAVVVGASALLSAWLPARRAGRIDPSRTLREEG
jgi:predicted permease